MSRSLIRTLGSLKFAVVLILLVGAIIGTATFLEAARGREFAAWYVYRSGWFMGVLAALALNIFAAALTRWPWQQRHAGFVLTHAGLLVLLGGAAQTWMWGNEGQIVLREGEQTSEMLVPNESLIQVVRKAPAGTVSTELVFSPGPVDWEEGRELDFGTNKGLSVKLLSFLRHAREQLEWVADDQVYDGPALKLALADSRGAVVAEEWLSATEFGGEAVMGPMMHVLLPVAVRSMEEDFLRPPTEDLGTAGILSLHCDGQMRRIKVDEHLGKKIAVGRSGVQVEIAQYLPYARPTADGRFESRGAAAKNPLLELRIHEPGRETPVRQIAFAKRPLLNLDGVHGKPCAVKFWYHHPEVKPDSGAYFMQTADGQLYCRTAAKGVLSEPQPVKEGSQLRLVGGFMMSVRRYFPRARQDARLQSVTPAADGKNAPEAGVLVEVALGTCKRRVWLKRGDPLHGSHTIPTDDGPLMVSFGAARQPLGYALRLKDFTRLRNPGSVGNASFSSVVEILDPRAGQKASHEISMNRPLSHGKYTFYQSSFEDSSHGKAASVLNAAYDPGRFLKYTGSLMICGGIFAMFYMRAYVFAKIPRLLGATCRQRPECVATPPMASGAADMDRRAA